VDDFLGCVESGAGEMRLVPVLDFENVPGLVPNLLGYFRMSDKPVDVLAGPFSDLLFIRMRSVVFVGLTAKALYSIDPWPGRGRIDHIRDFYTHSFLPASSYTCPLSFCKVSYTAV
jgi:hypothetical protein